MRHLSQCKIRLTMSAPRRRTRNGGSTISGIRSGRRKRARHAGHLGRRKTLAGRETSLRQPDGTDERAFVLEFTGAVGGIENRIEKDVGGFERRAVRDRRRYVGRRFRADRPRRAG